MQFERQGDLDLVRYLAAKRSVDDRSLNMQVFDRLRQELIAEQAPGPLLVLEIGCGTGTMVERLIHRRLFDDAAGSRRGVVYSGIDLEEGTIAEARRRLSHWARAEGSEVSEHDGALSVRPASLDLCLNLEAIDLFDLARREHGRRTWDLLIANAVLDTVDVPRCLAALFPLLRPGGLFYFGTTYDGATTFLPEIDRDLDDRIAALYCRGMDERRLRGAGDGDSRAGRHLFEQVRRAGGEVLAMGSSDWIVFPDASGYPGDEAYVLRFLLATIEGALRDDPGIDSERFAEWVGRRRAQVEACSLLLIERHLDLLGRIPPQPSIRAS